MQADYSQMGRTVMLSKQSLSASGQMAMLTSLGAKVLQKWLLLYVQGLPVIEKTRGDLMEETAFKLIK
jgi:hypothetical protein